jgi:hypothetical protein
VVRTLPEQVAHGGAAGSLKVFREAVTDPAELVAKVGNTWVPVLAVPTFACAGGHGLGRRTG